MLRATVVRGLFISICVGGCELRDVRRSDDSGVGGGSDAGAPPDGGTSDAGSCTAFGPVQTIDFIPEQGGDIITSGIDGPQGWSRHHYTSPIQGSEVWWPWQVADAPARGMAVVNSDSTVSIIGPGSRDLGSFGRISFSARVFAGFGHRAWLVHTDGGLSLVLPDGGLEAASFALPEPWVFTAANAFRLLPQRIERGAVGARAAMTVDAVAWQSESNGVFVTSLSAGTSRLVARPDGGVLAVAMSDEVVAWRVGSRISAMWGDTVEEWDAPSDFPSLAAAGRWVAWADGTALHAQTRGAGRRRFDFPDAGAVAVSAQGCFIDVLTVPHSDRLRPAYRLSLP